MAQSIGQLVSAFQAGGTIKIPACIVNGVELAQLGYSCYGNSGMVHRVSDICVLPSLGEEGELGGQTCNERWVSDLAAAWPDQDCTAPWFCGITGHNINQPGVEECQAPECGIMRAQLHEAGAALWATSLQDCEDLKVFGIEAIEPDNPAAEVIALINTACGRAKVGTCTDRPDEFSCSFCSASEGNLEVSPDTTQDAVNTSEINEVSLANNNNKLVETRVSLAAKRRSLRNGSDQLWPFTTSSTYHDHHDLVCMARFMGIPEKFLSDRLRLGELLDAVCIWIMRKAVELNIRYGNVIIDRMPAKFKTRSCSVLDKRFDVLEQLADTPTPNEGSEGFKPHHQFFIGRPGTTEDEVKGSEGIAVKPKTTVMNTDEFIKAVGSLFGAMSSTHRSFNPRVMVNTIFTNNDRKRKRESEGKGISDATASSKVKAKKQRKDASCERASTAPPAATSVPETDSDPNKSNVTRNANKKPYKIPKVVPGQLGSSGNQGNAALQTQGTSQLQQPHPSPNLYSQTSNRTGGRGSHNQSRSNPNPYKHPGKSSGFYVCNNQNMQGYFCQRKVYAGNNFCTGCGAPALNHPSHGGNLPVRRGGRVLGRGRGRGNFRGGNTGTHRGN